MPVPRTIDIPFPSFSLAMSQHSTSDLRLPSYRESYMRRFHPYPRVKLSNREMMQTIDDRVSSVRTLHNIAEEEETVELDPPPLEEQYPNHDAVNPQEAVEVADADAQLRVRHASLTALIIDLVALMARKLTLKTK